MNLRREYAIKILTDLVAQITAGDVVVEHVNLTLGNERTDVHIAVKAGPTPA